MSKANQLAILTRFQAVTIVALLFTLVSCGPDRPEIVPVTGTVLVDGKPVGKVQIMFLPAGNRPAVGVSGEDGRFRLSTFDANDGAVVGKHRVTATFRKPIRVDAEPPGGAPRPKYDDNWKSPVPDKYSTPNTSGLEVTVAVDGTNDFKLELTTK